MWNIGACAKHLRECSEQIVHLLSLVGKDLMRIHVMDDQSVVGLEYNQLTVVAFGTIYAKILQTDALRKLKECLFMAEEEVVVEICHELPLFQSLFM